MSNGAVTVFKRGVTDQGISTILKVYERDGKNKKGDWTG
jgi:hypothetical protein